MESNTLLHTGLFIEVPKEQTYNLPEGLYRARLTSIGPTLKIPKGAKGNWIRLLFEVNIPSLNRSKVAMAGRSFEETLVKGSELRQFLEQWLGPHFFEELGGQSFDIRALINRELEIRLRHLFTPKYEKPLVLVTQAHPLNSIKLTEVPGYGPDQGPSSREPDLMKAA